jgi:hypothetical protein
VFDLSGEFGLLVVQTRSPLVERDLDVLERLGSRVAVSLTIETDDDDVRRKITPTSPSIERRLRTLERLTHAGLRTQASISPVLPCEPVRFAELIEPRVSFALVDTLIDGDGAGGRRSAELGMFDLLRELGYERWLDRDAHLPLLAALRKRMGTSRVSFSQEGFNQL